MDFCALAGESVQGPGIFRAVSRDVVFSVEGDLHQPFWKGHNISGREPLAFRLRRGDRSTSYYGCVGKVYGVLLEGLATKPGISKRVDIDSDSGVFIEFSGGGEIRLGFGDYRLELSRRQAVELCDGIADYWRDSKGEGGDQ